MKNYRCLLLASILVVTGCATVKDARRVQNGEEVQLGERTPSAMELGLSSDKSADLADLEKIALQVNPSVRQAINQVKSAELAVQMQKAGFLPNVSGSVGYTRSTQNVNRHRQTTRNSGTWNGSVSLNLMIYDFGQTDAAVKQAIENYKAALESLRSAQNGVVYAVRTAYFSLHRSIELDKVAKETVAQYKEHLDHVQIKNEVGSGTPFDLTKAKVDYNNAILKANSAANDIEIAWTALINAIGLAENASFPVTSVKLNEYELDVDKLMVTARHSEPGLAALTASEKAANIYVEKTIRALYPSLNIDLGAVLSGRSPSLPLLWNLTGAAALSETIFDGNRKLNTIKLAVLDLKNARAAIAAYEQQLFKKLRTAALNARLAQKQLQLAKLTESQAQEYFHIVSEQYNVGKASSLERTDAQVSLSEAKAATVSATYDYQDALAIIAQLVGDFPTATYDDIDTDKPDFQ